MRRGCRGRAFIRPSVNRSHWLTHIEGTDIFLGFVHLGMERQAGMALIAERKAHGPYRSLVDFTSRVDVTPDQLDILIRIGAFRFTRDEQVRVDVGEGTGGVEC